MSETLRWTCPMSTRASIASLTRGSLRAGARNAPPPSQLPLRAPGKGAVHRRESKRAEEHEERLHATGHAVPPFRPRATAGVEDAPVAICRQEVFRHPLTQADKRAKIRPRRRERTSDWTRVNWPTLAPAKAGTRVLPTRPLVAGRVVRLHLADRGGRTASVREGAAAAGA